MNDWMKLMLSVAATSTLACGGPAAEDAPGGAQTASKKQLVVFHTDAQVLALSVHGPLDDRLRQRVEDFYPAACLDTDSDDDGVPNSLDLHSTGTGTGALDCNRCNRGPGTEGDFRLDLRGSDAELDRGRVSAKGNTELTVPSPDGAIRVVLDADTDFIDGQPTPGAEIRVKGERLPTATGVEILAREVKVLCAGPGAVPPTEVPQGTVPVATDDSGVN